AENHLTNQFFLDEHERFATLPRIFTRFDELGDGKLIVDGEANGLPICSSSFGKAARIYAKLAVYAVGPRACRFQLQGRGQLGERFVMPALGAEAERQLPSSPGIRGMNVHDATNHRLQDGGVFVVQPTKPELM